MHGDLVAVGGLRRPGTSLADPDRPRVVQQRRDVVGGVEHLGHRRAGNAGGEIRRVVADHQQRPARPDRGDQGGEQPGARLRRQLHELRRDQIEGVRLGRAGQQVHLPPLDTVRHRRVGVAGMLRGPFQRDAGDVGRDHRPSLPGEPDGVGSLAGPGIQRLAGWQAGGLGDELRVRVAAPDPLRGTVPLVPEVRAESVAGAMIVLTHPPSIARAGPRLSEQTHAGARNYSGRALLAGSGVVSCLSPSSDRETTAPWGRLRASNSTGPLNQ